MSVVSYTDVCVINVAAVMFIAAGFGEGGRRENGEPRAGSVICTRCHNGQVCREGRCGGRRLQGRRGD